MGSGCGSVGRAVTSDILYTDNCIKSVLERQKLRKNKPGMAHLKQKIITSSRRVCSLTDSLSLSDFSRNLIAESHWYLSCTARSSNVFN